MGNSIGQPPVLVTGATGQHGGTGRAVLDSLLAAGVPVRAMVRVRDARAEVLEQLGAHVVVGDYSRYDSLVAAMDGIDGAYFCYPVGAGISEAAGLFAAAAGKAGVKRIVDLSLGTARPDSPSPQGRAQWVAEQIFEWAGFDGVHIRIAAFFMENICRLDGASIRERGEIANAFGPTRLSWISGLDVGRVAARLLLGPGVVTARAVRIGGVEQLSYADIAEALSRVTGKAARYRELTPDAWREALLESMRARGQENLRGADHLVAQAIAFRASPPSGPTDDVERILGNRPTLFDQFIAGRRDELTPP